MCKGKETKEKVMQQYKKILGSLKNQFETLINKINETDRKIGQLSTYKIIKSF
jgi:hypothetical protein